MQVLFRRLFTGMDSLLYPSSALLGAHFRNKHRRRWLFITVNLTLWLAALWAPPTVGLLLLCLNLWLLVAAYWTWFWNEDLRSRIAKKIDRTPPDSFPRMDYLGLMTGMATVIVLILLFEKVQQCLGWFAVQEPTSHWDWFWFVLDKTYLRVLPDTLDLWIARVEDIHKGRVDYPEGRAGWPGRTLVLFAYALLYTILIQGLLRWWQVRRDISDAIAGVEEDPDMAVRLGKRATRPLLAAWKESDIPLVKRANMARALGCIGDARAIPVLEEAACDLHGPPEVRTACLHALGQIGDPSATAILGAVLLNDDDTASARAAAATGLGFLRDPAATAPLMEKLRRVQLANRRWMDTPSVRKAVVEALGEHLVRRQAQPGDDPSADIDRAVGLILCGEGQRSLLQDAYLRVRNRAATTISRLADVRGLIPLTQLVVENENPKLLQAATEGLGRLLGSLSEAIRQSTAGEEAVQTLLRTLNQSENDSVQESVVRGLGLARATVAVDLLWRILDESLRSDEESMAQTAAAALRNIDLAHAERIAVLEHQVSRRESQRRRLTVLGDMHSLEDRLKAARELGEFRDRRGTQALKQAVANEAFPQELREACKAALAEIRRPLNQAG